MASKPSTKPLGEMNEGKLQTVAKLFWPNDEWITQKRFNYDNTNKRRFYKVDLYSESRKIVWEYEGPNHYSDVWKLAKDEKRREYFENRGMAFLRWPYFVQLTRDVARHFFKEDYTERKYLKAIKLVYGVSSEPKILAPGFHTTLHTPANFVAWGERRFLEELNEFPTSLKHQVVHSLKLYIRDPDVADPYLVITESEAMKKLMKMKINPEFLIHFYDRAK